MHFVPRLKSYVTCFGTVATGALAYLCEMLLPTCRLRKLFIYWKS
jgi:hypothetical protein